MYNTTLANPSLTWPFLLRVNAVCKIYDLRLSFCLPPHNTYISSEPRVFSVYLIAVKDKKPIFKAVDYILDKTDIITYVLNLFVDTQGWIDAANSFIDLALDITDISDTSILVCALCILITSQSAKLRLRDSSKHEQVILLDKLHFKDGSNTHVSYDKGTLSVNVYTADQSVQHNNNCALSINGIYGNILFIPGPSIKITPVSNDGSMDLVLSTNKA